MKDLRACIRSLLLGDPAVSAAVGGSRIYPTVLPQGVRAPSVVQVLASEVLGYHMAGDDDLMQSRMQLSAWADTADAAVSLSNLVFEKLSGYKGPTPFGSGSPQDVMIIGAVLHTQARDDFDNLAKLYVRQRDYFFWHAVR